MQVHVYGHVTTDIVVKTSTAKNIPYVAFSIAEKVGYGKNTITHFHDVIAYGQDAKYLVKRGVKKGSFIWVSGNGALKDFMKTDGITKDKKIKITLKNWDYVNGIYSKPQNTDVHSLPAEHSENEDLAAQNVVEIDGERETLPV